MICKALQLIAIVLLAAVGMLAADAPSPEGTMPSPPVNPQGPFEITWIAPKVDARNYFDNAIFSSDGKRLLVVADGGAQVWDTVTWKPIGPHIKEVDWVCDVASDAAGKRVMLIREVNEFRHGPSGHHFVKLDVQWRVWDAETGKRVGPAVQHEKKDRDRFTGEGAALSPDGQYVAVSDGPLMELWRVETGKIERSLKHENWPVKWVFAPDNKSLAVVEGNGDVSVWAVESGKLLSKQAMTSGGFSFDMKIAGGRALLHRSGFSVLDIGTGRKLLALDDNFMEALSAMHISTSGNRVAFEVERETEIWDVDAGKRISTIAADGVVTLDSKGSTLVLNEWTGKDGGGAFAAGIWSADSGKKMRDVGTFLECATFSPDGNMLVLIRERVVRVIRADPSKKGADRWMADKAAEEKK